MKQTLTALLLTLCLMQTAWAACNVDGYQPLTTIRQPGVECQQCAAIYVTCNTKNTFVESISSDSYKETNGVQSPKCSAYYNPDTGYCDFDCMANCITCDVTTDFCTDCQEGYLWNSDYSCIPVLVPLQITTFILLLASIVVVAIFIFKNK